MKAGLLGLDPLRYAPIPSISWWVQHYESRDFAFDQEQA